MLGRLRLMDQPKALLVADVPVPRRRLSDQLGISGSTDEEIPSMAMAVIDASHRTGEVVESGRARSAALDAFDAELDATDAEWEQRRARLSLRR